MSPLAREEAAAIKVDEFSLDVAEKKLEASIIIHLPEGCLEGEREANVWRNRRFEGSASPQPFVTLMLCAKCDN